MKTPDVNC